MTTAGHKAEKTMVAGGAPARGRWFGALAAVSLAVVAGAAPARADLVKDLLGVNPFSRESSRDGLRPGVIVDESGEEIFCPRVDVREDGATVRRGEGAGLSYQMTIANLARECQRTPDGRIEVSVGVDVRALLGPSGRPGRFTSPMTIQVRRGDDILSRVTRQVSVAIPAGEANAMATMVERSIQLPENTTNLLIEVGFGGAAPKARKRQR
ncbi:hypothetical protein ACERNI_07140 [Camelimonas sp. ID_303_24]